MRTLLRVVLFSIVMLGVAAGVMSPKKSKTAHVPGAPMCIPCQPPNG